MDWIKSEGHTGVVRYYRANIISLFIYMYILHVYLSYRHLQADSWKIVSAADDKTLKVLSLAWFVIFSLSCQVWSVRSGERLLTLKSHTDGVTCLQFNDQVIIS